MRCRVVYVVLLRLEDWRESSSVPLLVQRDGGVGFASTRTVRACGMSVSRSRARISGGGDETALPSRRGDVMMMMKCGEQSTR